MTRKWNGEEIEIGFREDFNDLEFKVVIEELGMIIYSEICQLPINQISDSLTFETNTYQRTGTDG